MRKSVGTQRVMAGRDRGTSLILATVSVCGWLAGGSAGRRACRRGETLISARRDRFPVGRRNSRIRAATRSRTRSPGHYRVNAHRRGYCHYYDRCDYRHYRWRGVRCLVGPAGEIRLFSNTLRNAKMIVRARVSPTWKKNRPVIIVFTYLS